MTAQASKISAKSREALGKAKESAKGVYKKSGEVVSGLRDYTKENAQACAESGKLLGTGFRKFGADVVADSMTAVDVVADDMKEFAKIRAPKDLLALQSKIVRRNFAALLGMTSKSGQAIVSILHDASLPLSKRLDVTIEAARQ